MKVVVLLSGGLDSTTCLAKAVKEYGKENVISFSTRYGQKHDKECQCADRIANYYGVEHITINLEDIMRFSGCSLLKHSGKEIRKADYAEQTKETGGMPVETYVPFRNGLFLSAAASIALSKGAEEIWYGAHRDDAAGAAYPDCSQTFVDKMDSAIMEGTASQVRIKAPFVNSNKAGIVREGLRLGVPYEMTWSCYEGGDKPCGKCGTCIDRAKAFRENGVKDPLEDD